MGVVRFLISQINFIIQHIQCNKKTIYLLQNRDSVNGNEKLYSNVRPAFEPHDYEFFNDKKKI